MLSPAQTVEAYADAYVGTSPSWQSITDHPIKKAGVRAGIAQVWNVDPSEWGSATRAQASLLSVV